MSGVYDKPFGMPSITIRTEPATGLRQIVERGTHDELMARQGTYFELYESEG
jgi:hypothetical protein